MLPLLHCARYVRHTKCLVFTAQVYTAGGGSKNPAWLKIRENKLGVPVVASTQVEAAYGSALLAQRRAAMPVS